MKNDYGIFLKDITLEYELYHDRTYDIKEYFINFFRKRFKQFNRKETLKAINELNLNIHEGERVGILGFNGAGKSTLLKVISGILKPSIGEVKVNGTIQPLIEIGAGFHPEFSGRENIYFNGYMLGFTKQQIKDKEQEIISFAELEEFIDVPVKYYSSGMSVRLAFSIATSIEPEILIFDEMLSAGDITFVEKAKKRIDTLIESAKILVVVSHDLGLIQSLAKRVIVLDKGKVLFDGQPQQGIDFYTQLAHSRSGSDS